MSKPFKPLRLKSVTLVKHSNGDIGMVGIPEGPYTTMSTKSRVSTAKFRHRVKPSEMPWMLANIYGLMLGKDACDDGELDKDHVCIKFYK